MIMDIEVTNLNLNLIDADIQRLFAPYGEISSVKVVRDKLNNRSKGKAIIKMPVDRDAQKAIASLHGYNLLGKVIAVTQLPSTDEERFSDFIFLK
jgi:RNA recognition motif-containing protein